MDHPNRNWINPSLYERAGEVWSAAMAELPKESPAEWAMRVLRFDEPGNRGPFHLSGRWYTEEWLDFVKDPRLTDATIITGSQAGKTSALMAMAAWLIRHKKPRIFWVMPTRETVTKFAQTRWIAFLRASGFLLREEGDDHRHKITSLCQRVEGAAVDMVWSGSQSGMRSVPARVVILDEVSAFDPGAKDGDAVARAWERTKGQPLPKRVAASTPIRSDDYIWTRWEQSDQRRRFLPCPSCEKLLVLVWSPDFTVLPKLGCEAKIVWDESARREDGTWNLDRVAETARAVCPHCGYGITDADKTRMDRAGVWKPTAPARSGVRGWHLSSLYVSSPECSFGKLAVRFLQAKQSPAGLQAFVNGDLAEPWENQEAQKERVEIIVSSRTEPIDGAVRIMTVDHQYRAPAFWYVIRDWNQHSRLVAWGAAWNWEELATVQARHGVENKRVFLDSGHAATTVYEQCIRHAEPIETANGVVYVGWTPCKGFSGRQHWQMSGERKLYNLTFAAAAMRDDVRLPLLEFAVNPIKDLLLALRRKRTAIRWEVPGDVANEVYWKHLDAEQLREVANPRTGAVRLEWVLRNKRTPNHLLDCEVMQIAAAIMLRVLTIDPTEQMVDIGPAVQAAEEPRETG